jgi:ubiquinone/menaquinone biosynthesis C-methylase UbiE
MLDSKTIPKSKSDLLLNEWGFDLLEEYLSLIIAANFSINNMILDVATGTGRAVSILSRMGHRVVTGDYNYNMKRESEIRITNEYLDNINYIQLNLERIPFSANAVENIVCINTLHELDNPILCLKEIIRIHSCKGKLLIADFNEEGFDVMDKIHTVRYGKLHPRGKISSDELENILIGNYSKINEIDTRLNKGFIVSGKRNEK